MIELHKGSKRQTVCCSCEAEGPLMVISAVRETDIGGRASSLALCVRCLEKLRGLLELKTDSFIYSPDEVPKALYLTFSKVSDELVDPISQTVYSLGHRLRLTPQHKDSMTKLVQDPGLRESWHPTMYAKLVLSDGDRSVSKNCPLPWPADQEAAEHWVWRATGQLFELWRKPK